MAMVRHAFGALLIGLCACGAGERAPSADDISIFRDGGDGSRTPNDADDDGLCDSREEELGTDARTKDSDADGLPDMPEIVNGFDPTDPSTPTVDQLGYLQARLSATVDFPVRATVDGNGESISGSFVGLPALDPDGLTAADFFRSAVAVSADPIDSVRSINGELARFGSVLGKTRLAFSLRFEYAGEAQLHEGLSCARAYPFRYAIKTDDGRVRAERLFLLVLVPEGADTAEIDYCRPPYCQ
jgi:hypothetical protein